MCIREVQRSLKESSKRLIESKIAKLDVGPQFKVLETEIKTPGNGLIIFTGLQNHTAESIKSLEAYNISWADEAQSLSERSLEILRPTMRKDAELWFSWNPRKQTDPIDKLLRGNELPPRSIVVEANWSDNPWFPADMREEMEYDRRRDPDKYAWIWAGKYQSLSEARVFRNWRVEEFETPPDARFYYGADWGFSVDPTVLVRCWVDGRKLYVDREVYKVGCEIDKTPALFDTLDDKVARKWPIRADSARPETISYVRQNGYPNITPALKGANSVMDGVEFLKSYDIIVHPRCRHTIDELTLYSFKVDKMTNEVLPVLEDKKNHVVDSLRYAVEGLRRAPVSPTFGSYGR